MPPPFLALTFSGITTITIRVTAITHTFRPAFLFIAIPLIVSTAREVCCLILHAPLFSLNLLQLRLLHQLIHCYFLAIPHCLSDHHLQSSSITLQHGHAPQLHSAIMGGAGKQLPVPSQSQSLNRHVISMLPHHTQELVGQDIDDAKGPIAAACDDSILVKLDNEASTDSG